MRPLALLTTSGVLLTLQQLFSLWFLADFFLARDSSTAHELWNSQPSTYHEDTFPKINQTINHILDRNCSAFSKQGPDFEKLVLVVIDALGAEFLPTLKNGPSHNSHEKRQQQQQRNTTVKHRMPFVESSIQENRAMGFIAKAASPTVTMPRIKALLSGTIPSFVDILYNLASDVSKFEDENLLGLARASNKTIVFYGDDTWLSLFERATFIRSKETFSLFASDYTTVDTNVTEMALPETAKSEIDWDFLILHYLGLDHIGHVFGSNEATLVGSKLLEMDGVIREIYDNMAAKRERTMIVICGDHGMSKEGNHGGDSELESNTAMIFMPINQQYASSGAGNLSLLKNIDQVDLAATLSLLYGLPLPSSSKGVVIEGLLRTIWNNDETKLTCAILKNLLELIRLTDLNELEFSSSIVNRLVKLLQAEMMNPRSSKLTSDYWAIARDIKVALTKTAASQSSQVLLIIILTLLMLLTSLGLKRASIRLLFPLSGIWMKCIAISMFLIPILLLGSTDYIENEHRLWPLIAVICFLKFVFASYKDNVKTFSFSRFKMDFDPIAVGLFVWSLAVVTIKEYRIFLNKYATLLNHLSLLVICNYMRKNMNPSRSFRSIRHLLIISFGLLIYWMNFYPEEKDPKENLSIPVRASLQRLSLTILITLTLIDTFADKTDSKLFVKRPNSILMTQKIATFWMALSLILMRSNQFVFLLGNVVLEVNTNSIANSVKMYPLFRALTYAYFANGVFYCQGNTNLFSSIDVRPAFFGQTQYNVWLAVPLVAIATYSTQVYWHLKLFQRIQELEQEKYRGGQSGESISDGTYKCVCDFINLRNFLSIGYYMYVCMVLRNHLFIWSVISPKLVYHYVTNLVLLLTTSIVSSSRNICQRTS